MNRLECDVIPMNGKKYEVKWRSKKKSLHSHRLCMEYFESRMTSTQESLRISKRKSKDKEEKKIYKRECEHRAIHVSIYTAEEEEM